MKNNIFRFIVFLIFSNTVLANVSLPAFFSDNMVLQRNSEVKIWGWASPREEVKLTSSWDHIEYKIVTDNMAKWELIIKTPNAGGPHSILIKGYNQVILNNVLIGEVWLCTGQSNMEMTANWGIKDGEEAIKNATQPNIRFFTVPKLTADFPQNDFSGNWVESTAETMRNFSAVAYFFAKRLQEDLKDVPIGLISSNWGGTPAEIWMPAEVVNNDRVLLESANKSSTEENGPRIPGRTYNAMIHPLVGLKIAGVIWYQGESNVGSDTYEKTFGSLITSWRDKWKQNFPFYFVQIAPYAYSENDFGAGIIRNAQRLVAQTIPQTGMILTSDISTIDDIHPKDKLTVGMRLANLALVNTYKTNSTVVNGPIYKNLEIKKDKVIIAFDYADGLYFSNQEQQFEIAGKEGIFYRAQSVIKKNNVILKSKMVLNPVQVRFAWSNTTQSNLFNKANLPASTFISNQ